MAIYFSTGKLGDGMSLLAPSNAPACVTAVISAHTIRCAYAWQFLIIQYKMF